MHLRVKIYLGTIWYDRLKNYVSIASWKISFIINNAIIVIIQLDSYQPSKNKH